MSTTSQFFSGGTSIKSIQRGTIIIASGASSQTATVSSVTTSKSELRILGYAYLNATLPGTASPYIQLTNATTITATRGGAPTADTVASWELTEWN